MLPADDVHGIIVGDDDALEAPFLLENAIQKRAVAGGRDAVHGVVGAHDPAGAAFLDTGAEGLQVHFPEFPPGGDGGEGIMPAFPVIVHKMLGGGHDAALFQGLHVSDAHPGIQQHILAVAFLSAAPALVPRDVDDRGIDLPHAHGAQFPGHGLSHLVVQVLIEGRAHGDALREAGRAPPLGAVQRLTMLQHRDSPAAGRHGTASVLVDGFGHFLGRSAPEEVPHVPDMSGGIVPLHIELAPVQKLGRDLLHLLFGRKTAHQVFHPFFHGKGSVHEFHAGRILLLEGERQAVLAGAEGLA